MSNVENLLNKVREDAEKEVEKILREAEEKRKALLEERKQQAEQMKKEMLLQTEKEVALLKERLISNARLKARDDELEAKRDVLERVFQGTLENLENLDEQSYATFVADTLATYPLEGNEVLIVPERYQSIIKKSNLPVKLSERETCASGFILKTEKYILDHTFQEWIAFERDRLELELARKLFSDGELVK